MYRESGEEAVCEAVSMGAPGVPRVALALSWDRFLGQRAQVGWRAGWAGLCRCGRSRGSRSADRPKPSPQAPAGLHFLALSLAPPGDGRSVFCLAGPAWPCSGTQAPSEVPPESVEPPEP